MDADGYFVTETYTEYEEVSDHEPSPPPPPLVQPKRKQQPGLGDATKKKKKTKPLKQRGIGSFFKPQK